MGKVEDKNATEQFAGDENPERGNWTGKLDFLLSCLGYAVGLGNVWRFPYLCFKHGGGAFLIPYVIMLLFIGIPCFLLELTLGQYSAMGPVVVYSNLSPLFKGLGFANFLASCFVGLYYNMIIAWTIYYLFASFTSQLPWDNCKNDFNTEFCFNINDYKNCTGWRDNNTDPNLDIIYHKGKCLYDAKDLLDIKNNLTHFYGCEYVIKETKKKMKGVYINKTYCAPLDQEDQINELFDIPFKIRKTASQEYLEESVLNISDGMEDMGPVQWHLALCLLAAWVVIFLCLIKGIKSSGKVVYFTATFPYLILLILLIKAATLPGAYEGIKFYMVPDWHKLSDIKVWEGAAVQIFFSLSVAGGGLITLSSYNKFHNNVLRDTMIVCFGNCLTSVFAGFAIFSILGFLAGEMGVPVDQAVKGGTGLAFIAYPDLVTRLPIGPLWAILFFAMLFTLGLDSQFAIVETILTGVLDFAPQHRSKKTFIVGGLCIIGFICGLPLTTRGGSYLLDLLDYYAAGWPYLFIGLTELVIISHVYGVNNFFEDLRHMIGLKLGSITKIPVMALYMVISPLLILIILIISWVKYEPLESGGYEYPSWCNAIGWIIAMAAILAVPVMAVAQISYKVFFQYTDEGSLRGSLSTTFDELLRHTDKWRQNAERARRRDNEEAKNHSGHINMGMVIGDEHSKL